MTERPQHIETPDSTTETPAETDAEAGAVAGAVAGGDAAGPLGGMVGGVEGASAADDLEQPDARAGRENGDDRGAWPPDRR